MARLTNILQTYNQSSLSFAYLNSYIQKANSVNSIAQEELIQIQALREEFIKSYKKTQSELQYMVSEINKYYQSKVLAWEWAKAEFSSDMLPIKAIYDEMRTRFVQAQHRFETTPQVIREYENIEEQIQPVLIKLNEIVGRIQERQKDFSKRYNYFLRVITRESANPTENSALFVERLAKFCEIARSHSDPDEVDIVLAAARNLVIDYRNGNFNQRYIAQIDTFIQNYGTIIGSIEAPHGNVAIGDHASQSIRR
jgi:hypothetical protein